MRLYYFLPVFLHFFFATNSHAQLTNETKSLGGSAFIQGNFYKDNYTQRTQNMSRSVSIYLAPSYAVFKNNFLFGATIGSGLASYKTKHSNTTNNVERAYINYGFNINPSVRYYVKNNSKLAYFAFIDAAYYGNLTTQKFANGTPYPLFDDFNWKAGIGGHKVFNKNFVAEGLLYYGSEGNIAFQAYLRHFYTSFDKKNQEAPPQYIAKNRWQVAASFSANNNFNDKTNYVGFYLLGGKMLDNHFMLGSSLSLGFSDFSHSVDANFSLSPFVRYYIPLSSRLFVYPYISANANFDSNNYSTIRFNRGVGLQYFMTKNLALTCTTNGNFEHIKTNSYRRTTANGSLNFGFSYFVK